MREDIEVIDFLRAQFGRIHERFDRTVGTILELAQPVGALELGFSGLWRDYARLTETVAHRSVRLDSVSARLDRVGRRLPDPA
jgi:hypothetical protein